MAFMLFYHAWPDDQHLLNNFKAPIKNKTSEVQRSTNDSNDIQLPDYIVLMLKKNQMSQRQGPVCADALYSYFFVAKTVCRTEIAKCILTTVLTKVRQDDWQQSGS